MDELKTKYKFIYFKQLPKDLRGKIVWELRNNRTDDFLGDVEYYPQWRQWVASFDVLGVFNHSCLTEIAEFLQALNKRRKCGQKKQAHPEASE